MTTPRITQGPPWRAPTGARRWAVLGFGLLAYLLFLAVFASFVLFVARLGLPGTPGAVAALPSGPALALDLLLVAAIGMQHSLMARAGSWRLWARWVPRAAARSVRVLVASAVLGLLMLLWQPLPAVVWRLTDPALSSGVWALCATGWVILIAALLMIDHAELFGLRQAYRYWRGLPAAPATPGAGGFHQFVRQPMLTGLLIALWCTPHMTAGHLLLAVAGCAYLLVGAFVPQRDLATGPRAAEGARRMGSAWSLPVRRRLQAASPGGAASGERV